jgi:translation initiation factor 3 subunit M
MATVIPTSEEDPVLAAVRFSSELAWADAGPEVSLSLLLILVINCTQIYLVQRYIHLMVSYVDP